MSRRTQGKIEQLEKQIMDVLRLDHPQSVRHLFYRMTDPRLPEYVEKSEQGYRHVQQRVKAMRIGGRLTYGWITDTTRRGHHVSTFGNAGEFLQRVKGLYRANIWADAGVYCEVWAESRSIAGVIEKECNELAVSLYPSGGFASITIIYEAAKHIKAIEAPNVQIIYVGDYDPAGVLIDRKIADGLRGHGVSLTFHRVAINVEQIREYDLPEKPRKASDKRMRNIRSTVEAEAMPAAVLRELIREKIEGLLPAGAIEAAKVAEEDELKGLEMLAGFTEKRGLDRIVRKLRH